MAWIACSECGTRNPGFERRCASCEATLPSVSLDAGETEVDGGDDSLVGTQVGHYQVERILGAGGAGVVYRAVDQRLGRPVALKVLSSRLASNDRARARMLREARAAALLDHAGIATIYEVGEVDGRPFIAMALYEGDTLKDEIARGPMDPRRAIRVAADLCSALSAAHAAGIVHRDVKPANVAVIPGGGIKILDFGLAKVAPSHDAADARLLTGPGAVLGTVAYMAPEQLRGQVVDARADLWTLGVIVFEMVAGQLPFGTSSDRILSGPCVELGAIRPGTPPELSALVSRLLERDVERRIASAGDAERELSRLLVDGAAAEPDASRAVAAPAPAEGVIVAERFRLVRELGRGAMGAVWLAEHLALGKRCALKLIVDAHTGDDNLSARFEREARALAQLKSRHVVQVLDHGIWRGRPFIAMEYLEGETLRERLARCCRLSPEETARWVTQIACGLDRAHAAGIVHRDLKPENVFLARDEEVAEVAIILDFGVAKASDPASVVQTTHSTGLLGTPAYMSPEQASGQRTVDHRSDLWSLGVIAFECLTGRRPFDATAIGELCDQILSRSLPVPSQVADDVPPALDAWWLRAAARDPDARFQAATELADTFARAARPDMYRTDDGLVAEAPRATVHSLRWVVAASLGSIAVAALSIGALTGGGSGGPARASTARHVPALSAPPIVPVDAAPPATVITTPPAPAVAVSSAPRPTAPGRPRPSARAAAHRPPSDVPDPTMFDQRD